MTSTICWVFVPLVVALSTEAGLGCDSRSRQPDPSGGTPPGQVFTTEDGVRFVTTVVAANLQVPWSLAFAPDGRLFFTERPGRVRILAGGNTLETAVEFDDAFAEGEAGVLGLALHPDFERTRWVYVAYTARSPSGPVNRLVRYREVGNRFGERSVLIDNLRAASIHDGARVRFGPDRQLYLTMGDAADPSIAQDLGSFNGKILRLTEDGLTPAGNPFSSPIWSYGHRNPQGLDWHPAGGLLFATEHGPTGNDEVNIIAPGANYGWPDIQGMESRPGMERPLLLFNPAIAPSGASFYTGSAFPGFRDNFFFGALRGQHLHRVRLDSANPGRVIADERLLEGRFGRIRDVVTGPDGALYFSTSNRDGRATPAADDDRIVRISPAS